QLLRREQLRMDLIAIDSLEPALPKVLLGRRGQQVELAQSARREAIEQLAHDAASDAFLLILGIDGDRTDQRRELISLRAAAADDALAVVRDDERLPMILEPRGRESARHEEIADRVQIGPLRRGDGDLG